MSVDRTSIAGLVGRFYDAFPYPYYPLLAKARWQDGYLGASDFARLLSGQLAHQQNIHVLSAGSGEMLPYVLRKLEPSPHALTCLDVSRSSLRRARVRLLTSLKRTRFVVDDVDHFLGEACEGHPRFDHVDAFGVLHHLAEPAKTLRLLGERLSEGGTMRVMVYNSPPRRWIHHLQHALEDLGLVPWEARDRAAAREILDCASSVSPVLRQRLKAIGGTTLSNKARLADTFFHVRELNLPPSRWFEMFDAAGLSLVGLYDRYGEWDDVNNPLWQPPSREEIERRAGAGMFEGNLELILRKGEPEARADRNVKTLSGLALTPYLTRLPPARWFAFDETRGVSLVTRQRLWWAFVRALWGNRVENIEGLLESVSPRAVGRLARLGAILPCQVSEGRWHQLCVAPLEPSSEPPKASPGCIEDEARLEACLKRHLRLARAKRAALALTCAMERLRRASL